MTLTLSTPVEAVVACGATAEKCECAKPTGHVEAGDIFHRCDPMICSGEWVGDYADPITFLPISPPIGIDGLPYCEFDLW